MFSGSVSCSWSGGRRVLAAYFFVEDSRLIVVSTSGSPRMDGEALHICHSLNVDDCGC